MDRERAARAPAGQPHMAQGPGLHFEGVHVTAAGLGESPAVAGQESQDSSIDQPLLKAASEGHPTSPVSHEGPFEAPVAPPAARSKDGHVRTTSRYRAWAKAAGSHIPRRTPSELDWIVPTDEKGTKRRTVGERLDPTIENAVAERNKYASKAMWTGYALNIAIGMQVFLGALTTGLAAAVKDVKQAQLSTSILGGLSTMVASYLARARGSGEPEVSIMRVKDLDHFLRDCRAFRIDHAHRFAEPGDPLDHRVEELRRRLEELLGNSTQGKNSTVGIAPISAPTPAQVVSTAHVQPAP